MMIRNSVHLEVKSLNDDGYIEGYGSVFGNIDLGGDKMRIGAFSKSLDKMRSSGQKIKMLWNHDPSEPIGIWESAVEDNAGLFLKGRLVMEVARAREVHALLKAGAISGLSIGYSVVRSKKDGNARLLEEVELYEVSPVTFPMNQTANVTMVKSDALDRVKEKLISGETLTIRDFEVAAKGLGLSNLEAERAAMAHKNGLGDPAKDKDQAAKFLTAILETKDK